MQQAILCIINVKTRFAAAWPLQLIKKKDYEEAYTPKKGKKRNVNFRSMFTVKDSHQTLIALIKCLVNLKVHGKSVKKVYSDDGPEFNSEVKQFCQDPMRMIHSNPSLLTAFNSARRLFGELQKETS